MWIYIRMYVMAVNRCKSNGSHLYCQASARRRHPSVRRSSRTTHCLSMRREIQEHNHNACVFLLHQADIQILAAPNTSKQRCATKGYAAKGAGLATHLGELAEMTPSSGFRPCCGTSSNPHRCSLLSKLVSNSSPYHHRCRHPCLHHPCEWESLCLVRQKSYSKACSHRHPGTSLPSIP
jgi:hypothetical protein